MPVRTKTLAVLAPVTALTPFYTVPAGETAIVKSVALGKLGTPATTVTISVLRGATAYGLFLASLGIGAAIVNVETWWVLMPGDVLRLESPGSGCSAWVSGAELEGVAD